MAGSTLPQHASQAPWLPHSYKLFFPRLNSSPQRRSSSPISIGFSDRSRSKMAAKLKVDELRAELSLLGLPTTGTKPTLVRRLTSAMRKEAILTDDSGGACRKRKREVDGEEMGVASLGNGGDGGDVSESEGVKEVVEEKFVRATKKGGAVLDQRLPDHIKSHYHVISQGDEIYDAVLNQTNVGTNNNKFYVIQALQSDDGNSFIVYNRWGRVGVKGQDKLHRFTSRESAINEFLQKFLDKTKNQWCNRREFVSYPRSYTWLEMDYNGPESDPKTASKSEDVVNGDSVRDTKLKHELAKFISLICNISMMKQQMVEIGYNAEKLPLGKLSKATILKGYDILRQISDVIDQSDKKKLELLSGEFYTVIPHDFGFKKMSGFVIDTPSKLKAKLEMVQALGEIETATKLLGSNPEVQDDPLYSCYERLCCELTPVEVASSEFLMIEKYMRNTHAKTHSNYTVDIVHIFKVSRQGEDERFERFRDAKNKMLLWHGSRLSNWVGILSQGLRIAPPEAPVTGYMFGKGVYFADMFSKSANYCYASETIQSGVLLLCEVALGEMVELTDADYNADRLPTGKLSTKGVGGTAPNCLESLTLDDGVIVPFGRPKKQSGHKGSLLYNEYIVYDVDQIRMKYVVHANFNIKT